jgi:hypothetical protein
LATAPMIRLLWILPLVELLSGVGGPAYEHRTTNDPLSVHIAVVDPRVLAIEAGTARGLAIGRETVTAMAGRVGAVLAVNGGFFRIGGTFDGDPAGILKIGDEWLSEPSLVRGALGWRERGRDAVIGRVGMEWAVTVGGRRYEVDGVNRQRGAGELLLFTSVFGPTTLTSSGGSELVVDGSGRVVEIVTEGNAAIPPHGMVVSFGTNRRTDGHHDKLGSSVHVEYEFVIPESGGPSDADWRRMDFIVGGTPVIVRGGEPVRDFTPERVPADFVEGRHPRTAVGIRPDGKWVFVVADGRRPDFSIGMTLAELAELMLSLGCAEALNLDGGGSSTFYLYGRVMNLPSDLTGERPVSDAILVKQLE